MKKYSILIVGLKCYSGHIREFIVNLKKKNPQVEITLLTYYIRDEFKKDIKANVKQIYRLKSYQGNIKNPTFVEKMNIIKLQWSLLKLHYRCHFDIVDIHFAKEIVKYAMPILRMMTKNIIITPWGSDVMRVEDKKAIKILTKIYSKAKHITVSENSLVGKCAITKFNVNPEKLVNLGWGGEFFDFIYENAQNVTTEIAKERFGLNDRFVITCGYNTQPQQRHEDIVNAIYEVKDQLPKNLTLLFPFTYGSTSKSDLYTEPIIEKCRALGLNVVVVKEHLEMNDLLKLRMATDVFVHVQETDAGSRCVMEYIYCNKKVVHGSWIKYAYLEDNKPSCYFPVDKMENLGSVIVKAYNAEVEELPQEVKNIILKRGWTNRMTQWNAFFESLVS